MKTETTPEPPGTAVADLIRILKSGATVGGVPRCRGTVLTIPGDVSRDDADFLISSKLAEPYAGGDPERQVQVRVIKPDTLIGVLRCAAGHEQPAPWGLVELLIREGSVELLGL